MIFSRENHAWLFELFAWVTYYGYKINNGNLTTKPSHPMLDDQTLQEHFNISILKEINIKSSQEAEWLGCNDLFVFRGWGGLSDKCLNHTPSL